MPATATPRHRAGLACGHAINARIKREAHQTEDFARRKITLLSTSMHGLQGDPMTQNLQGLWCHGAGRSRCHASLTKLAMETWQAALAAYQNAGSRKAVGIICDALTFPSFPASPFGRELSENERHAVAHARYQVEHARQTIPIAVSTMNLSQHFSHWSHHPGTARRPTHR